MIFEINDIIQNNEVTIKLLTYELCEVNELNLAILNEAEQQRFVNFISTKRKLEFFFTRLLWSHFDAHQPISYSESGRPRTEKGFISISHSRTAIAIAYSENHLVGLDIEHFTPKVFRIKDKFLSPFECDRFDTESERQMTTLWSIKEAVYKLADTKGLSFRENIKITAVGDLNEVLLITDGTEKKLIFSRITFDHFILIYCIRETLLQQ